jgi:hypothetical protein
VVTIAGGAAAITTDTTPTIGGTTDVAAPGLVTVTVAGQTLTATPSDGAWSVTSAILANGAYPIVASVSDGAGNPGSATQQLTVDTVLPVVTIDHGQPVTTNDPSPTITGTSDLPPGTVVRLTVDSLTLTALVQSEGTWNITPAGLPDGTRTVTASVTDAAGNEGTDSQALTVDTAAPAVAIAGGANGLTNDATPDISGTANVAPGSTVSVNLADETLTAPVQANGAWSVTAAALPDGPHRVVMSVSDEAGNPASSTQTLVVDTLSPAVAITGGPNATTNDVTPTISGTSNAAPGTTVTVSIAGQSMTTLLQANGTWNATPTFVGEGTRTVVASAPDPAGNVGSARQTLTIDRDAPSATPTPTATPKPAPNVGGPNTPAAKTTLSRDGSLRIRGFSLWIATKVTAPLSGRVVATANGTVKIRNVRKAIRLTRATARIAAGRSKTLRLKPWGAKKPAAASFNRIKTAVTKGRKVTATITVRIVDAAGNARTLRRTVKLTR